MNPVCLVFLVLPVVSAQSFHWGSCPTVSLQSNFSLEQYLGKWYEIEHIPVMYENGKCRDANFVRKNDGVARVLFSETVDNKVEVTKGSVYQDAEDPAMMEISYYYLVWLKCPWWVLYTDYSTVSVVYSCESIFNLFYMEYSWIISRTRLLTPDVLKKARQVLVREKIDISSMMSSDQTGCVDKSNGQVNSIQGVAKVKDQSEPAVLSVSFFKGVHSPYWVLSTDYQAYALVYSCSDYLGLFHIDFAWILARTRTLTDDIIVQQHDKLAAAGVNINHLTVSDQTGCDVIKTLMITDERGIMSPVCLLFLILPLVTAQTYHWGPCPNLKVQPNFNLQQYLGKWYEIEKLPASFERGKCIEANYAVRSDGTIRVVNSQFYKDKVRWVEGTAVVEDPREPARLGVSFSYFTPYSPYWVLTTDYASVSVVYSCSDILRLFHVDYAWILGRARFLHPHTVHYAKLLLAKEGIDVFRMKATDQMGCKDN
ncbi:uncharacterized protein ACJ7VT_016228 [Polymixia lowei]